MSLSDAPPQPSCENPKGGHIAPPALSPVWYVNPYGSPLSKGHTQTELCRDQCAWKGQHAAARDSQLALKMWFTVYDEELEQVSVFKYLGCLRACKDNDTQAMQATSKRHVCWARISRVLRAENAAARVCGFFKTIW